MGRLFICDHTGSITADIEVRGAALQAALDHEQAEIVIRCAILMALSALAEGGPWPGAVLEALSELMARMRDEFTSQLLT